MYCPKCGTYNNEFVSYCYKCGYELKGSIPSQNENGYNNNHYTNEYHYSSNRDTCMINDFAGFWKRFAAWIIDYILLNIVIYIIELLLFPILGINLSSMFNQSANTVDPYGQVTFTNEFLYTFFIVILMSIIINWLYYALMECSSKQGTIGKMAVGIKVTDYQGERIGFGRATGRFFAKYISGFILCIGYFMAGFTSNKQALHDIIASTYVINK